MPDNDRIIEHHLESLLSGMSDSHDQVQQLKNQIQDLKSEYESARSNPDDDFATYQNALAGALPGITQGTLAAVTAFQKQPPDALAGSAAVMDICSSLSSALGSLSTAGGPPGAVLGALFSMVSMILNFFAPKPPSLLSQIEALMRDLQAETEDSQIRSAADAVTVFAEGCSNMMQPTGDQGLRSPVELTEELKKFNLVEGNTITTMRTVRHWLMQLGNQDLGGWPEILQLHNDAYMHLTMTVTRVKLYAHDHKKIKKYVGDPNPDADKVKEWSDLQVQANVKFQNLKANNKLAADFFKQVLPIARKRGTFAIAFHNDKIYVATGTKVFDDNKWVSIFDRCRRMALTRPRQGVNMPSAVYDLWVLDAGDLTQYLYHNYLNIRKRVLTEYYADYVGDPQGKVGRLFLDVWPTQSNDGTYAVYGARDVAEGGGLEDYKWNRDAKTFDRLDWSPVTQNRMVQVRIAKPIAVLPDDPERDDMPAHLKGGWIHYGTLENSKDIFVYADGPGQKTVPIPMDSYTGIAFDSYFLWVYGKDGIACATHASIMSCITNKRSTPRWLGPPTTNNMTDVIDLSPCEDSTLLVSTSGPLSTAVYRVDFATPNLEDKQRLTVDAWEHLWGGNGAAQVQKLPVYGWPLLERSIAAVGSPASS